MQFWLQKLIFWGGQHTSYLKKIFKERYQEYKLDYSQIFTKSKLLCFLIQPAEKKQEFEKLLVILIKSKIKT